MEAIMEYRIEKDSNSNSSKINYRILLVESLDGVDDMSGGDAVLVDQLIGASRTGHFTHGQ